MKRKKEEGMNESEKWGYLIDIKDVWKWRNILNYSDLLDNKINE